MKKRVLSMMMAIAMILSIMPVNVFAADENVVEVGTFDELKTALENAGASGAGDTTISITADIELSETDTWTPVYVHGYTGADVVTIEGNNHKITGLNAPLFSGGFAGGSGIIINDLTIADSNIESTNTTGSGAFIESVDSMAKIELNNCHLLGSTLSGSRTGGLIGYTAGYNNQNDGPVKTYVTIHDCSVVGNEITASGSLGGIIGHSGGNAWTYTTITNCTVEENTLTSTDDGGWRVGVVVGTVGVGEQNDIEEITSEDNTLSQGSVTAPEEQSELYGRFVPGSSGVLTIDGEVVSGSNVVASIGSMAFATLDAAVKAAQDEDEITLLHDVTEEITIPDGAVMTIDLGDHTLNGSILAVDATLIVQNGTIENPDSSVSAIEINDGALTLTDVKISSARHAIRVEGPAEVIINSGEYGLDPIDKKTLYAVNASGGAKVTIKAGVFTGPKGTVADSGSAIGVNSGATVIIEGGTFTGGKQNTLHNKASNPGAIIITGGTFDQDPTTYVAEGYKAEMNTDGNWVVSGMPYTINLNGGDGTHDGKNSVKTIKGVCLKDTIDLTDFGYSLFGYHVGAWNGLAVGETYTVEELLAADKKPGDTTIYLYADWEPNQYYINFNGNGGTHNGKNEVFNTSSVKYTVGYEDTITFANVLEENEKAFSKLGYEVSGWKIGSGNNAKVYGVDEEVTVAELLTYDSKPDDDTIRVTAVWAGKDYTLNFNGGKGLNEGKKVLQVTVNVENLVVLGDIDGNYIRDGYTLIGWDSGSTGHEYDLTSEYKVLDLLHNDKKPNDDTIYLSAVWAANADKMDLYGAYRVLYYTENVDGTWELTDTQYKSGLIGSDVEAAYEVSEGFEIDETSVLSGTVITPDATGATSIDGVKMLTLEVRYARAEYGITINEAEGGKVVALVNGDEATAARYGEEVTFVVTPNEGWKLISMNYQVYNGGQIGGGNAASNPVIDMPAGNVVVKPVFEKIIYTITVAPCEHGTVVAKVNGVEANTATIDDVIEIEVTPEEGYQLQKLNYSFTLDVGGGAGGGLKIGESLPMRAGNVRISAVFEPIIYTITFKAGEHGTFADGVKEITVEAAYASAFPKAPELTADKHFAFTAWTPALPATVPLNGGTYTAQWTQVSTDPSVVEPAAAVYFVNHYVENEAGEYELKETERLTAKLGTTVTADSTKYVGTYHRVENNLSTLSGVVTFDKGAADPMATLLTLNVYYEKYATDITGPIAPVAAAYRVQYFTENLDGSYTLTDTQYKTGVIGESADATYTVPQNYKLGDTAGLTGIVYVPNAEGAASIDEVDMLTLKVYYDLNEYTVTFDSKGGTAVDNQTVKHGGKAAEPATPARSGYNFDGWCLDGKLFDFDTVITSDITLIALWDRERIAPASSVTYKITVDADGVTSSHSRARKGETVTLTVEDELEIVALDKDGDEIKLTYKNGKYTFKMPACAVTVKAVEKVIHNPFADVADDAYYTDAVLWALTEGITTGTGTDTFSPDAICTRAQVVTFLWRAAGEPAPKSAEMPFSDVTEGAYYYAAVLWAVENNITAGTSATTFSPDDNCTRAQIVTFLWRSQGFESASAYNPFTDVVSDTYYTEAVLWAVENGITIGTSATTFSPAADCTRGQIVTFLYRCLAE